MKKIQEKIQETKNFLASKTLWTNVVIALFAIIELVNEKAVSPNLLLAAGIVNIALRVMTTKRLVVN